jgi:hypothetical protein
MKCKVPNCESTDLVFSGTDAFQLGLPATEKYCRGCAVAYYIIKQDVDALIQATA